MPTNFPSSNDDFTNPNPSDSMSVVSHSDQHTNINDAVEKIQEKLTDGDPFKFDFANEKIGIGTDTPGYTIDMLGASSQIRLATGSGGANEETVISGGANASINVRPIGTGGSFVILEDDVHTFSNGRLHIGGLGTSSYKLEVNGDINTTGIYRVDGDAVGGWRSYTPTLYTYSGSSDTHQVQSSTGYTHFNYAVVGDIVHVQAFVRYSTGFVSSSSCSSTLRPRYSVPPGYPVASNSTQTGSGTYALTNGWGSLATYPSPGYNGSVLAVNDGSTHSSNGYLQFMIQRPSNSMGSSNGYFYSSAVATQDNPLAAVSYAYIHFTTWYRTT